MPEIPDIALALLLTGGSHEMGHQTEADRLNEDINFNGTRFTTPATGNNLAKISGAGFRMQDIINLARNNKTQRTFNALHKMSYLAKGRGDLKSIEKSQGKKARDVAKGALFVSSIADLMGSDRFRFGQSSEGTPMLILTGEF